MPNTFHIDILAPDKKVFSGDALSATVPAEYGYMGILANHAPLLACLAKGKITVKDSAESVKTFDVPDTGFVEILKNNVTIIL